MSPFHHPTVTFSPGGVTFSPPYCHLFTKAFLVAGSVALMHHRGRPCVRFFPGVAGVCQRPQRRPACSNPPCPATCRRSGMHRRRQRLTARRLSAWWWIASWSMSELTVSARSGDLVAWWCHDPTRDRSAGHARRIIGPLRSVDQPDRRTRQGAGRSSKSRRSSTGKGIHPKIRKGYTSTSVRKLLSRCELTHGRIGTRQLDRHEWWLPDLARALQMPVDKLIWAIRGRVRSRQVPPRGLWVVWADGRERRRLWKLMADSRSCKSAEQTSS